MQALVLPDDLTKAVGRIIRVFNIIAIHYRANKATWDRMLIQIMPNGNILKVRA